MEQNFYRDEFEQMLRDTTDDFRMHPPRKVWYSIYNNFHPDRKWPSLAVSLILLTAILYIGITNNNSINKTRTTLSDSIAVKALLAQNQLIYKPAEVVVRRTQETQIPYPAPTPDAASNENNDELAQNLQNSITHSVTEPSLYPNNTITGNVDLSEQKIFTTTAEHKETVTLHNNHSNTNHHPTQQQRASADQKNINTIQSGSDNTIRLLPETAVSDINTTEDVTNKSIAKKEANAVSKLNVSQTADKAWIEDYAFHNKKNSSKWKSKLSMQFYITPSVGYRTRFKNNDFEPNFGLLQRQSQATDPEEVTHQAAMNIEAGASLIKQLNKRIRLRAGLQFNYSNYITYAHKLQHPGQTTVLLNDINTGALMPVSYSSSYGNVLGENNSQLNNSSVQLSIPIGVDYKLMGNDKIKWYAGASLQPGFVLNGNSYLVSADYKHFAEDESLLRSFNVNSAIETFISIKAPSGTMINLGPQLRYQLMSTHTKQYAYTEKLYNIGFKIGITKKL